MPAQSIKAYTTMGSVVGSIKAYTTMGSVVGFCFYFVSVWACSSTMTSLTSSDYVIPAWQWRSNIISDSNNKNCVRPLLHVSKEKAATSIQPRNMNAKKEENINTNKLTTCSQMWNTWLLGLLPYAITICHAMLRHARLRHDVMYDIVMEGEGQRVQRVLVQQTIVQQLVVLYCCVYV